MQSKYRHTSEDLFEIAEKIMADKSFLKGLPKLQKDPFDAAFHNIEKTFIVAVAASASSYQDKDAGMELGTMEACLKLACSGARFLASTDAGGLPIKVMGIVDSEQAKTPMCFQDKGETIYLLAADHENLMDIQKTTLAIEKAQAKGAITAAHCISQDKGLFASLIECAYPEELGFDITTDSEIEEIDFLYGDCRHQVIVTVNGEQEDEFVDLMFNHGVRTTLLGHVTKGELRIDDESYGFIDELEA